MHNKGHQFVFKKNYKWPLTPPSFYKAHFLREKTVVKKYENFYRHKIDHRCGLVEINPVLREEKIMAE